MFKFHILFCRVCSNIYPSIQFKVCGHLEISPCPANNIKPTPESGFTGIFLPNVPANKKCFLNRTIKVQILIIPLWLKCIMIWMSSACEFSVEHRYN